MFRKHLSKRMQKAWTSYTTRLVRASLWLDRRLKDDGFSPDKRKLLHQALQKGDVSSPVVEEWLRLAERYYPKISLWRMLRVIRGDVDILPWGRTFRGEK